MISQSKFLERLDWFYYWRSNNLGRVEDIDQQVDINKLENIISLESVVPVCYQSMAHMIHNQAIRRECRRFGQQAPYRQGELRKIFCFSPESEINIENKACKYLMQLEPSYLSFRSLMNLSISLTAYKIDNYRYLSHRIKEHHGLLNSFVEHSVEEMHFLRGEKKTHIHEVWGTDIKISLD